MGPVIIQTLAGIRSAACCGWLAAIVAGCLATASAAAADWSDVYVELGHTGAVLAVAVSPDSRTLASGGADGTVRLWDIATGRQLRSLAARSLGFRVTTGQTPAPVRGIGITSVAFSPDGRMLAAGDLAHYVRIWDIASGHELYASLSMGHNDAVTSVAFAPDGRTLASGGADRVINLWDLVAGRERTLSGHAAAVTSVAFASDGHTLISGSLDRSIKLWDVAGGQVLRTLAGHSDGVMAVALAPDGRSFASASLDHSVKLWDFASGRELHTFGESADAVTSVAFAPDGRSLAAGVDRTIRLWSIESGRELATLSGHAKTVTAVAYARDGRMLASGSLDHDVKLWNVPEGSEARTLAGLSNFVDAVALSPDAHTLASGNSDHSIRLWDLTGAAKPRKLDGHSLGVIALAFSPDGRILASGSRDHTVRLWDAGTGGALRTLEGHSDPVVSLEFAPDGHMLASTDAHQGIRLWDPASGQELHILGTLAGTRAAFSPDGRTLAIANPDCSIHLWNLVLGRETRTLAGHTQAVNQLIFSPDGQHLLSSGVDGSNLWDLASGQPQHWQSPYGVGVAAVMSPDGRMLATATGNTITFLDAVTGREQHSLSGHSAQVRSLAFSRDGHLLVSGAWDDTVRVWNIPSGRQRASAVALGDGGYLLVTPQGYYDYGGATAEQQLLVRTGAGLDDVSPISAYRERFFRPDLVRLSLLDEPPASSVPTLAGVKLAPEVSLADVPARVDGDALNLSLSITDRGGGIGELRVFVNGSAVVVSDGRGLRLAASEGRLARSISVRLVPGRNDIAIIAYNAEGSMHSNPVSSSVFSSFTPHDKPTLRALVVGIDRFRNPALQLRYPVADATAIARLLRERAAPLFAKVDVQLLTAPEATTRDALLKALASYGNMAAQDVFLFYVASHGTVENEDLASREYYLIPSDVGLTSDEALHRDAISQTDLKRLIGSIPATKKVLLLDTCQAGALGEALALSARGNSEQTAINILSGAVGSTVLSAATSQEQALEGVEGHGVFTWVVLQGLAGNADVQHNGYVSTLDLASYVGDQVPKVANAAFKREQFPDLHNAGQSFPLVSSR